MPKASAVAAELRKVVELLEKHGDVNIVRPTVWFLAHSKEELLAASKMIPRPAQKRISYPGESYSKFVVEYKNDLIDVSTEAPQSQTCVLVKAAQKAVYECPSLLSDEEEESLGLSIQGGKQ